MRSLWEPRQHNQYHDTRHAGGSGVTCPASHGGGNPDKGRAAPERHGGQDEVGPLHPHAEAVTGARQDRDQYGRHEHHASHPE